MGVLCAYNSTNTTSDQVSLQIRPLLFLWTQTPDTSLVWKLDIQERSSVWARDWGRSWLLVACFSLYSSMQAEPLFSFLVSTYNMVCLKSIPTVYIFFKYRFYGSIWVCKNHSVCLLIHLFVQSTTHEIPISPVVPKLHQGQNNWILKFDLFACWT